MAPSSGRKDNYDVFLSFRGKDTRSGFANHLYQALRRNNINVFIDDKNLKRGKVITEDIERVIEGAKMSIVIFSKNYADSTFCLYELMKIMECRESQNQIVFPIFYKVEPEEDIYDEHFAEHEDMEEEEVVERWRSSFLRSLELAGEAIDAKCVEADIIAKISTEVFNTLQELNILCKGQKRMSVPIIGETAEENSQKILKWLMNDKVSRVGIHGMGGAGKTTIVTHIYNHLLQLGDSVGAVFWVTVSKGSNTFKLQSKIAKSINLDLSEVEDESERAAMLWEELERIDKFVLILDDVWEPHELETVGIPLSNNGGKLLLTTRDLRICRRMDCQPIQLKPLSERESWELFLRESKLQINDSPEWQEMAESVAAECSGLPLSIVVMARRMRGVVDISEWRDVFRVLTKPSRGKNQEMEEHVFKPLKLSYDSLLDDQYRQCFLYFSLFPEDYELRCDVLIEYFIGEGLIERLDSKQAEFDRGNAIINELVYASLLEVWIDNGRRFVKMHDVVRDMAQIALRESCTAPDVRRLQRLSLAAERRRVDPEDVLVTGYSRSGKGAPSLTPNFPELTTFIIEWHPSQLPDQFFAYLQNLVVLDLRSEILKSLPYSVNYLGHLRVLLLGGCYELEYIPSLAGLKNLWHLDLSRTNLKAIPHGMETLINLRVLRLSGCGGYFWPEFFPCHFLWYLPYLQVLEIEHFDVEPDMLINLAKLESLRIVFYNLQSLKVYLRSGHWQRLSEYFISFHPTKKSDLSEYWGSEPQKKVMHFKEIRYLASQRGEIDIILPHNMQWLSLSEWNGPLVDVLMQSTFPNFQRLGIFCDQSIHFFSPSLAQRVLRNVEMFEFGSEKAEEIISSEGFTGRSRNTSQTTIVLPKLKTVRISWSRNLRSIYRGRIVCPSLERIEVHRCGKLQRLPFCVEDQENARKIKLDVTYVPQGWWDSLQWDDVDAKSRYELQIHAYSEA